ncbi:MAG: winged helix-turn-helix transcriptional regulator [Akkermansia sp.]
MYEPKLEKDIRCALDYGLSLIGGRWKSRILCILGQLGRVRYGTLREQLVNISDTVLSATLKELLSAGLILREQFNEIPPHTEYRLSEQGERLQPILLSICRWAGTRHNPGQRPLCARCRFDDPREQGRM